MTSVKKIRLWRYKCSLLLFSVLLEITRDRCRDSVSVLMSLFFHVLLFQ